MNEFYGHFLGALTVLIMLSFIGIWIWAWLPRHKRTFGELASLPMQDEDDASPPHAIPATTPPEDRA